MIKERFCVCVCVCVWPYFKGISLICTRIFWVVSEKYICKSWLPIFKIFGTGKNKRPKKRRSVPVEIRTKLKCTFVQALRLCTGRTAHRESRGIALPFHVHGTRRGWRVSVMPRPLFTRGKNPVPIVQWAPGPVWTGAENLAPPQGFDPRTVQPVASRCTDYATRPTRFELDIPKYWSWGWPIHHVSWSVYACTSLVKSEN